MKSRAPNPTRKAWNLVGASQNPQVQMRMESRAPNPTRKAWNLVGASQNPRSKTFAKEVTDLVNMTLLTHYCQSRSVNLSAIYKH
jgi:hypothetical protein